MKSRTLISFCQRPGVNPAHAEVVFTWAIFSDAVAAMAILLWCPTVQAYLIPSKSPVCRAIMISSLVGMTHVETLLCDVEMRGPRLVLASASSSRPSQVHDSQIRRRISAE